jgi:hypothetical protein
MNIDFGALNSYLQEYNALSNKPRHTKEDKPSESPVIHGKSRKVANIGRDQDYFE